MLRKRRWSWQTKFAYPENWKLLIQNWVDFSPESAGVKTQVGKDFLDLKNQYVGSVKLSFFPEQMLGTPLPPEVLALLAPYRVPNV